MTTIMTSPGTHDEVPPPIVLFVDDEPERLSGLRELLRGHGLVSEATHPLDLQDADLDGVHLISVDEYLGDAWAEWLASTAGPSNPAASPSDGLAVAAALASRYPDDRPRPAVTVHTGKIDVLGEHLPSAHREPLLAASHNLDWVFRWEGGGVSPASLATALADIAVAVASLPVPWTATADDFGIGWLGLPPSVAWFPKALQHVEDCRPPAHGLASNTHGRAYLRWLAQRVLPYPAFLLDANHASLLLGILPERFGSLLDPSSAFGTALSQCQYSGPLARLLGPRWWRAGLLDLLSQSGTSDLDSPADRASALQDRFATSLVPITIERPVIAYNAHGHAEKAPVDSRDAVRLQPDGWPVFADDAWASIAVARQDPAVCALVTHADRARVLEVDE